MLPPGSRDPPSVSAPAVISRARSHLHRGQENSGSHRKRQNEATTLPLCIPLMRAIDHCMAYDVTIEASIDPTLIDIHFVGHPLRPHLALRSKWPFSTSIRIRAAGDAVGSVHQRCHEARRIGDRALCSRAHREQGEVERARANVGDL